MIRLERINGAPIVVNPDLIRFVEQKGDTVLTFMDGLQLLVKEKPEDVVRKIIEYRRALTGVPEIKK